MFVWWWWVFCFVLFCFFLTEDSLYVRKKTQTIQVFHSKAGLSQAVTFLQHLQVFLNLRATYLSSPMGKMKYTWCCWFKITYAAAQRNNSWWSCPSHADTDMVCTHGIQISLNFTASSHARQIFQVIPNITQNESVRSTKLVFCSSAFSPHRCEPNSHCFYAVSWKSLLSCCVGGFPFW